MKFKVFVITYSIFLTGCAIGSGYNEPPSGPSISTVKGSTSKNDNSYYCNHLVDAIDNKSVGVLTNYNTTYNVKPGYHNFVIESQFTRSFISKKYKSLTDVSFVLKPNENYKFVGRPEGSDMKVWVIDSQGKKVTAIATSKYIESNNDSIILPRFIIR